MSIQRCFSAGPQSYTKLSRWQMVLRVNLTDLWIEWGSTSGFAAMNVAEAAPYCATIEQFPPNP